MRVRMKVVRMMWGLRLAVTLMGCLGVSGSAGQRFLCSSDSVTLWWDYEGPVVFTSLEFVPCTFSTEYSLSYTAIPMFTIAQAGWSLIALYRNNTWAELSEPLGPCEDYRICDVIKGETIRETIHYRFRHVAITPAGEYQFIFTLNTINDFKEEFSVRVTVIVYLRGEVGGDYGGGNGGGDGGGDGGVVVHPSFL